MELYMEEQEETNRQKEKVTFYLQTLFLYFYSKFNVHKLFPFAVIYLLYILIFSILFIIFIIYCCIYFILLYIYLLYIVIYIYL